MHPAAEVLTSATDRAPKTVLGFFAIALAILASACAVVVGLLARVDALHALIPWVLGFGASVLVAVLAGVFITAWKDPTILMLGQVTGEKTDLMASSISSRRCCFRYSRADGTASAAPIAWRT
jgi:hypothetical protein